MKIRTLLALTLSALLSATADQSRVDAYKAQLRGVRPAELPGETAKLVAKDGHAADAVTAAISLNSPAAGHVVGSVSKAAPKSAGVAAASAVALQPKLAAPIIIAATKAAPAEVSAIVAESCKANPALFYTIGMAAATAAPKSSDAILPAITTALPMLKPVVERARKDFAAANRAASLALLLKHTENLVAALARKENSSMETLLAGSTEGGIAVKMASLADAPPAPVQLPPFVPSGQPPEPIPANQTTEVDPGGRNYSTP